MLRPRPFRSPCCCLSVVLALLAASMPARARTPATPPPAATTPPPPAVAPLARANRLAISLGFGFGSAGMSSFHGFAGDMVAAVGATGELSSSLQINAELGVRYYFPYFVLAQVGYGTLYNWTSSTLTVGIASG